jgi:hypothetical protein
MSEEAAASEILKRMGVGSEPPADGDAEGDPQEPESDEDAPETDGEPEEDPEESEDVEIDVAGEKYKLPAKVAEQAKTIEAKVKEIEAGATRKFQEAAELRKVAEAQTEHARQIAQLSQAEVDLLADQRTVERRLQQLLSLDTSALYESDPAQLARLTAEAQQLQFAKQRIDAQLSQTREHSKAKAGEAETVRMTYLGEWAKKNVKGWSEDYSQTLLEFSVKELGADPQALRGVMSEPVLRALDLAYRGWKVQTTDPKTKQVVATKTLKPGATGQTKTSAQQTADTANRRFAQTKKVDDAAALILARMNARKR